MFTKNKTGIAQQDFSVICKKIIFTIRSKKWVDQQLPKQRESVVR